MRPMRLLGKLFKYSLTGRQGGDEKSPLEGAGFSRPGAQGET